MTDTDTYAHGRSHLGALIGGSDVTAAMMDPEVLVEVAQRERVVCYVHHRLSERRDPDSVSLRNRLAPLARAEAVRSLLLEDEARRIGEAFARAGIPFIWLKGAALASWCYGVPHLRDRSDLDVLFASHADALRAAAAVDALGYRLPLRHIAGDLYVHELLAVSETRRIELDLHWAIANTALFSQRLRWHELDAEAMALPRLGPAARGLSPVHALVHACIHRACNQRGSSGDRLQWLLDLHLLAATFHQEDWERVVALSVDRRLADVVLQALHATRAAFGTPISESVIATLTAASAHEPLQCGRLGHWWYFQWMTLRELSGWRARLRWLRQMLVGDLAHVRERYGADGAGNVRVLARRLRDGLRRLHRALSPNDGDRA